MKVLSNDITSPKFFTEMLPGKDDGGSVDLHRKLVSGDNQILPTGVFFILIYVYVLMDSHPHLIIKMSDKVEFSRFMQRVHSEFAQKLKRKLKRKGHVVMDRPKTPVVENENYLTNLMFYLDLNPVKTRKPKHPAKYKYSSYHY